MEDKGVSPIIATILLVAITVTLAATFYSEVSPYFAQDQYFTPQAQIQIINGSNGHSYSYSVYISYFPGSLNLTSVDMEIVSGNSSMVFNMHSVYSGINGTFQGINVNASMYSNGPSFNAGSFIFIKMSSALSYISFVDTMTGSDIAASSMQNA